jgi:chromate transporter
VTELRLFWMFFKVSLVAFGGVFGVLPELQRGIAENGWMTPAQFVQAYAVSQFVPGPNMAMTAVVGYAVDGVPGA